MKNNSWSVQPSFRAFEWYMEHKASVSKKERARDFFNHSLIWAQVKNHFIIG